MSKKGKKKGCKNNTLYKNVLLATAILNLLIQIAEFIAKLID